MSIQQGSPGPPLGFDEPLGWVFFEDQKGLNVGWIYFTSCLHIQILASICFLDAANHAYTLAMSAVFLLGRPDVWNPFRYKSVSHHCDSSPARMFPAVIEAKCQMPLLPFWTLVFMLYMKAPTPPKEITASKLITALGLRYSHQEVFCLHVCTILFPVKSFRCGHFVTAGQKSIAQRCYIRLYRLVSFQCRGGQGGYYCIRWSKPTGLPLTRYHWSLNLGSTGSS